MNIEKMLGNLRMKIHTKTKSMKRGNVRMDQKYSIKEFANMQGYEPVWMKRLSFTSILISSNLLQTMFSKTLGELTSKQWLLLTIASSLEEKPTLSELGKYMGCSRQNVKQIAEILSQKEYLEFTKKEGDKNTLRVSPTEKWFVYAKENDEYTSSILEGIFDGFSEEELKQYFVSFCKLMDNIEQINNKL